MQDISNNNKQKTVTITKKGATKKRITIAVVVLVLGAIGLVAYKGYIKTDSYKAKEAQKQTAKTLDSVKKLIILPEGEPSIFVVQDPDLLTSQQAFFNGSIKGDQLLVYPQSGKAIIYSPSRNIIVNSGPVTFDDAKKINSSPIDTKVTKASSTKK